MVEGDIYLDSSTTRIMDQLMSPSREALVDPVSHWPNGRLPYKFGAVSNSVKEAFRAAIDEYEANTCIRFVERTDETDYILVVSEGGCWSPIGRSGGQQKLSLGTYCDRKGTAMHELMHTLGFFHEQSRRDRDNYITIHWDNIQSDKQFNFQKYEHGKVDTLGAPYDYGSIMHYPMFAFSSNGRATIVPKDPTASIGQRSGFSKVDLQQLNKLYCSSATSIPPTTAAPTKAPCKDEYSSCYFYANWYDYCRLYPTYMNKYCQKSCGFC
ncbi:predicted protein [Nematostella vectensis]|uniref:Metalloendopeptidase n=1 Tax=Nematostella vectensis TaxID=45351 RepID=A7SNJ4_NEMVE|nr:predicted protein [Nematostella vectensis]|eukprot:XP_001626821.1 predicted protein [Nematostella vectensis]